METWIECAGCGKWRRVSALASRYQGEDGEPWHCSDNADARFNLCSVAQESTDAEIDERLAQQVRQARRREPYSESSFSEPCRTLARVARTTVRCMALLSHSQ